MHVHMQNVGIIGNQWNDLLLLITLLTAEFFETQSSTTHLDVHCLNVTH